MLARPLADEDLNRFLPPRFFELQDVLRAQAREVVGAAARHDAPKMADDLGALTRGCVSCHDLYLHEQPGR